MLVEGECRAGSLDVYRSSYCLFTFHLATAAGPQLLSENYLMDSPV